MSRSSVNQNRVGEPRIVDRSVARNHVDIRESSQVRPGARRESGIEVDSSDTAAASPPLRDSSRILTSPATPVYHVAAVLDLHRVDPSRQRATQAIVEG